MLPPTSQVPGLNYETDDNFHDPIKPLFRDTDTTYVRLAKQGGRQNLLQFKENPNMREKPAKHYPRPDWFYLEDNALEDAETAKPNPNYNFMVPEYMIHEEWNPANSDTYERPRRAPFAYDLHSAYEREGDKITDKTLKLPEVKKPGYGVRSAKPLRMKPKSQERTKPSTVAKQSQIEQERPHLKYLPLPETGGKDKASMAKILGYEYERQWHEEVNKWQYKQDRLREKHRSMLNDQEKEALSSEYKSTFGKSVKPYVPEKGRKVWETSSNKSPSTSRPEKQEKELFKLTRFKNVGSKVDSHRPKEVTVAAH